MEKNVNYFSYNKKYNLIAGVDEAGRGPLVGSVVAAAVILPEDMINEPIDNDYILTDSKKLSEKKRNILYDKIITKAISYSIAEATPKQIDDLNIHNATLLAMKKAVNGLNIQPGCVLIDGKFVPNNLNNIELKAIIKGDLLESCISAASILAKVTRDKQMVELDNQYPQYGFAKHKGYPTKLHMKNLVKYGPIYLHRKSYRPVKELID